MVWNTDKEKYILPAKKEMGKRRRITQIECLISERRKRCARYTEEQIEQVRSANDIVDVIGASVRLKRSGSGYVGLCPFHSEKSPSFSVNPARQMYKCFGCGVGGNVITFVMEYENYSFPEAMESLAGAGRDHFAKAEMTAKQKQEENLRSTLLEINAKAGKILLCDAKISTG